MKARIPQGNVLAPSWYLLYESDMPKIEDTFKATFTDHPVMIDTERDSMITTLKVQNATDKFLRWTKKF